MQPNMTNHGWCGDPRRGAALGRSSTFRLECPYCGDVTTQDLLLRAYTCGKCDRGFEFIAPKVRLRRIRLNQGGYDSGGAYWGHGEPLYWAGSDCGSVDMWFRARNRGWAKILVRAAVNGARFYR